MVYFGMRSTLPQLGFCDRGSRFRIPWSKRKDASMYDSTLSTSVGIPKTRTNGWKGEWTCMTQGCFGPQNDAIFEGQDS